MNTQTAASTPPRSERFAWMAVVLIVVGLPVLTLGYQYLLRPMLASVRTIEINAVAPEAGGFSPAAIRVEVGETVALRFAAQDVTHGIAIGPGLGVDLGHIDPGEAGEIILTFDTPGTYTYYCNTWCSSDHWRMRGVIEVREPTSPNIGPTTQRDPVIEALQIEGIDIDATHESYQPVTLPFSGRASALHGADHINTLNIPDDLLDEQWRRTHSPLEALDRLLAANPETSALLLADVAAYLWLSEPPDDRGTAIERLYNQNCAACHGQSGNSDGPASAFTAVEPAAFADPVYMFAMRSDVLYAKIRRGGMGTDMPNFGTLFTPEETWELVNYLWQLALETEAQSD